MIARPSEQQQPGLGSGGVGERRGIEIDEHGETWDGADISIWISVGVGAWLGFALVVWVLFS